MPGGVVKVLYTLYGDTNLDGKVTGNPSSTGLPDDAQFWVDGTMGTGSWRIGDLNYDGNVDSYDKSLFGDGANVTNAVAPALAGVAAYKTRVDLSWAPFTDAAGAVLSVDGYMVRYKLDSDPTNNNWTIGYINKEDAIEALIDPTSSQAFGTFDPSPTILGGDVSSTAIGGLNPDVYDFELSAIVGGSATNWSSVIVVNTNLVLLPTEPNINITPITIAVAGSDSLKLSSSTSYHNLWIKRVDNTTGDETILSIDHADFIDTAEGSAYTDAGLTLWHEYSYYACEQAGVPALPSYWKLLNATQDSNGANRSYIPAPAVQNILAFEEGLNSSLHLHLQWVSDVATEDGFNVSVTYGSVTQQIATNLSRTTMEYDFSGAVGLPLVDGGSYTFNIQPIATGVNSSSSSSAVTYHDALHTTGVAGTPVVTSFSSPFSGASSSVTLSWSSLVSDGAVSFIVIEQSTDGSGFNQLAP